MRRLVGVTRLTPGPITQLTRRTAPDASGPLWVISRPKIADVECPPYPKKRTSSASASMSAKCHKQTKKNQATDPLSTRYLPLDQITKDNFKDLKVTWRWKPAIGPAPVGHPFRSASSAEASGVVPQFPCDKRDPQLPGPSSGGRCRRW